MRAPFVARRAVAAALAVALPACAPPEGDETDPDAPVPIPLDGWEQVTVADGTVFLLGERDDGAFADVLAWDLSTNAERWRTLLRRGDGERGGPRFLFDAGDALVVALPTGIAALDAADGRERWRALEGAHVEPGGAANGAFYGVVDFERFVAVDLRDGPEIGSVPAPSSPPQEPAYFGCESLGHGGRSATLVHHPEGGTRHYRVALWPELGGLERIGEIPESAEYARDWLDAAGVDASPGGGVALVFAGDAERAMLQAWSTERRTLVWEIDLPDGDGAEPVLFDGGPWFLLRAGASMYELRRADDAAFVCALSLPEGSAPTAMTSLDGFVALAAVETMGLYGTRDCALRWSGPSPGYRDFTVDFDAQHLVMMRWGSRLHGEEPLAQALHVVDLERLRDAR